MRLVVSHRREGGEYETGTEGLASAICPKKRRKGL